MPDLKTDCVPTENGPSRFDWVWYIVWSNVDVYVNQKLVARGEVVVADENFGIRIKEIVAKAGGP